jgi:hypothetical protein
VIDFRQVRRSYENHNYDASHSGIACLCRARRPIHRPETCGHVALKDFTILPLTVLDSSFIMKMLNYERRLEQ